MGRRRRRRRRSSSCRSHSPVAAPWTPVRRLWNRLTPTQSRTRGGRTETLGPRQLAQDGRYEHLPLRFVDVDHADLDILASTAAELGRAVATQSELADAVAEFTHDQETPADVVAEIARLHGLLDLSWTVDFDLLFLRAAQAVDDVGFTAAEEAAYRRTVDRINGMWGLGNTLDRFQY